MNLSILLLLSICTSFGRTVISKKSDGPIYKEMYEKEKVLNDHLRVENSLLKEQYRKISSVFHGILHKRDRLFVYLEDEILQLEMKINEIDIRHSRTTFFYSTAPLLILSLFIAILLLCFICGRINQQESN